MQQLPRQIHIPLEENITKAIHSMDNDKIITEELTTWISNMVVIEKPDKL